MRQIFQIGDVVVQKDLGRKMMVINDKLGLDSSGQNYYNGSYRCGWYEKNEKLIIENFPQERLEFLRKNERNIA